MGGSERKSKEIRKKRSGASSSEDEGRSKRPRTTEDEKRESRRSDKREKRKEKKSHKQSKRHSDKEKKSKDVHRGKHHRDDHQSRIKFEELSKEDYFSKNNEFAMWLKDEKKVFFSDLSSESARELFSDFVEEWNSQYLESRYYEGIVSGPRTSHNWKIKK